MSEPSFDANKLRPLFADLAEDGPGGVLAVIRGGEVILHHAFGMANVEHQVANACDTVFYIASTSKQFVGTAITLLESEGLVDLEAEVRDFLPELHAFDPALRVFHLLHHTSGLRDKYALAAVGGLGEETYATDAGSRELIFAQRTLNFEPGSRMMYSNSNYFLLAQIVERVSGTGFEEFTRERIFEPLGMSDTRFRSDSSVVIPGRASGYRKGGDGTWRLAEYTMNSLGPGGVVTTVDDLAKWSSVFFGKGGLGLPDLADRLTRTRSLTDGKPNGYALGLMLGEHLGRPTVSHGGGVGGFSAELIHFAEDDLSVACLCNTSAIPAGALARRAATILLDLPGANASKAPKADGELASPDPRFAGVFASPDGDMVLQSRSTTTQRPLRWGAAASPLPLPA
jgi:CubicO group peptidase (beta-lactamase class C family)